MTDTHQTKPSTAWYVKLKFFSWPSFLLRTITRITNFLKEVRGSEVKYLPIGKQTGQHEKIGCKLPPSMCIDKEDWPYWLSELHSFAFYSQTPDLTASVLRRINLWDLQLVKEFPRLLTTDRAFWVSCKNGKKCSKWEKFGEYSLLDWSLIVSMKAWSPEILSSQYSFRTQSRKFISHQSVGIRNWKMLLLQKHILKQMYLKSIQVF